MIIALSSFDFSKLVDALGLFFSVLLEIIRFVFEGLLNSCENDTTTNVGVNPPCVEGSLGMII